MGQARFLLYPWFHFGFDGDQTQTSVWQNRQWVSRNREGCLFAQSCLSINQIISDLSKNFVINLTIKSHEVSTSPRSFSSASKNIKISINTLKKMSRTLKCDKICKYVKISDKILMKLKV